MMKKIISIVLILLSFGCEAQLQLPFIDDFHNDGEGITRVNPNLYQDSYVHIEHNYTIRDNFKKTSHYVAVFNAKNENNQLYSRATEESFVADMLTTKHIDLSSYTSADNIRLSFYFQPGGCAFDCLRRVRPGRICLRYRQLGGPMVF